MNKLDQLLVELGCTWRESDIDILDCLEDAPDVLPVIIVVD